MAEDKPYNHTWEKLWLAVYALATSSASVQKRVDLAARSITGIWEDPKAFPADTWDTLQTIRAKLTSGEGDDPIATAAAALSDADAREMAEGLLQIYWRVQHDSRAGESIGAPAD